MDRSFICERFFLLNLIVETVFCIPDPPTTSPAGSTKVRGHFQVGWFNSQYPNTIPI